MSHDLHIPDLTTFLDDEDMERNRIAEDRRWIDAVETSGTALIRALGAYGFPASDMAATANMSIEARNLHNAARRFIAAFNSTGIIADEPAVTNGQ